MSVGVLTFFSHLQAGAKVGSPQDRELVAKALLAACNSAVAKDPEVLQLVLSVCPPHILQSCNRCISASGTGVVFCPLRLVKTAYCAQKFSEVLPIRLS